MIAVSDRRDAWVGSKFLTSTVIASEPWLDGHRSFNESEMALFFECVPKFAQKVFDTADIVRDAILQQLSNLVNVPRVFQQAETVTHKILAFVGANGAMRLKD